MDSQSKVLILYASAGHGHEKAAKAVGAAFKEKYPQTEVILSDILTLCGSFYGAGYKKSYIYMIQRLSWLWGLFYYGSDVGFVYWLLKPFRRLNNAVWARPLQDYIVAQDPSVIISAHFMSTEVAGYLKDKKRISAKLITIVTDYLPHYFWVADRVDWYVTAIPEGVQALVRRGVRTDQVKVFGIPTDKKFSVVLPRRELFLKYGVEEGIFTVLLTSGGAGVGAIETITKELFKLGKPVSVLVVCGTNKVLREKLLPLSQANQRLKVFGFVDTMNELMQISDAIVGKGGGLTISEALCEGKPMIIFQPVPGQESRNAVCMTRYEAAMTAASLEEVIARVRIFLDDPKKLNHYQQAASRLARPNAAFDIADLAQNLIGA